MKVLVTGASGLIGTALCSFWRNQGWDVFEMSRTNSLSPFYWDLQNNFIKWDESIHIEAVVHLAGENISQGRWTSHRKKVIEESRVQSTLLLSQHLANLVRKPNVFISGSAIGWYGDTGANLVDEGDSPGDDFLANVCQKWEEASRVASDAGIRTLNSRTGLVLSNEGGALPKMLTPFRLGVGGQMGSGRQLMSWVRLRELVKMIDFMVQNSQISGPVNAVAPTPVSNGDFTKLLGITLSRPTFCSVPSFLLKKLIGEMANALLLVSAGVVPAKLQKHGFKFRDVDLDKVFNDLVN